MFKGLLFLLNGKQTEGGNKSKGPIRRLLHLRGGDDGLDQRGGNGGRKVDGIKTQLDYSSA